MSSDEIRSHLHFVIANRGNGGAPYGRLRMLVETAENACNAITSAAQAVAAAAHAIEAHYKGRLAP